ncbi:MAG: serine hydrolase domain-containing protein [bacterium]|nr:serine hydrolase domain-containing protein [bacterium]
MLDITSLVERAVRERVFPGCVIGVVKKSGLREILPFGHFTYEDSPAVEADSIYDIASITKSIPTTSLALMFIDKGQLKLADKLIDYVPEYRSSYREMVTIKHLLTYTVGGPQLSLLKDRTPAEILLSAYSHELAHKDSSEQTPKNLCCVFTRTKCEQAPTSLLASRNKPGTVFAYSNVPALFLGLVVEMVGGNTLDKLAQEYFFDSLKMDNTTFFPRHNSAIYRTIVPTEIGKHEEVRGIVHDESARVFAKAGRVVGHAGLFSTVPDILNFMEMLLHEGEFKGRRYLSPEIIREMSTNQIPELAESTGLGWELNQPFMGTYAGAHTFGKTGFTGTSCVCDIEKGVALVILSNRTYPARPKDRSTIDAFRADIADIILAPTSTWG